MTELGGDRQKCVRCAPAGPSRDGMRLAADRVSRPGGSQGQPEPCPVDGAGARARRPTIEPVRPVRRKVRADRSQQRVEIEGIVRGLRVARVVDHATAGDERRERPMPRLVRPAQRQAAGDRIVDRGEERAEPAVVVPLEQRRVEEGRGEPVERDTFASSCRAGRAARSCAGELRPVRRLVAVLVVGGDRRRRSAPPPASSSTAAVAPRRSASVTL